MTEGTIVAIATPPGRGGIGVVRLSGARSFAIVQKLLRLPGRLPEGRHATVAAIVDPETGRELDRVIVTLFPKPASYTGEDVAEISAHGAPVVLRRLVECSVTEGARLAEPGEFTMRAFLNGRIDLTQAEAVRDLIDARTLFQARIASEQLGGSVSTQVKPFKEDLLNLIARLEAGIDFAEDDVDVAASVVIVAAIERIAAGIEEMAQGYEFGRIVRDGLTLAIVGRPNVGKSSLFNRLLNEERAIVTEIPGTTRDLVTETASLSGIPVRLADTAGIRASSDPVEQIGVERSLKAGADADLRLLVLDASQDFTEADVHLLEMVRPHGPLVIACNKCDLPVRITRDALESATANASLTGLDGGCGYAGRVETVWTSATSGEGLPTLGSVILSVAGRGVELNPEAGFITNLRQHESLKASVEALRKAREAASTAIPHEMILLDLYEALHSLDALTGATTTDDVLGIIFSTFCVGK